MELSIPRDNAVIAAIEQALAPLKGLPLWDAGRAATMLWLALGDRRLAPTQRNPDRITGEFAIHVQCAWRVSGRDGVVAGFPDMYLPSHPGIPEWEFDPDRPGNALADSRLKAWITAYAARPLVVSRISVDRCDGFCLFLSEGFKFEVFPAAAGGEHEEREQWRLLRPGVDEQHVVVDDRGIHTE